MYKISNILKSVKYTLVLMVTQLLFAPSVFATNGNMVMVNGVLVNPGGETGGIDNTFNQLFDITRTIVSGITGILAIVMVGVFTWKAFTFARTGDNPSERAKAINGMIFFFIGAACFGAASLLTGVFYNMLRGI